jgi:hypothetical protein
MGSIDPHAYSHITIDDVRCVVDYYCVLMIPYTICRPTSSQLASKVTGDVVICSWVKNSLVKDFTAENT